MSSGDVEIKLNGKIETLRPSLAAAKRLNAVGFTKLIARLREGDLDAYFMVASTGLSKKTSDIEDAVYSAGMPQLADGLVQFVNNLANGGKPFQPKKLKTVEIEGKVYAEVDDRGEPIYIETAGDETAGEG